MTTLTVGELFAGYGGLGLGLNLLTDTRTAWVSDIAPGPRKLLAHRFPDAPNLGDVTTVDWTQVEPVDVIAGGSPCFVAGTPVLTHDGLRPIEDVQVGDLVWTHAARWRRVTRTMRRTSETIEFRSGFYCTPEHRLWLRTPQQRWNNSIRQYRRHLDAPEWVEAKDSHNLFAASPVSITHEGVSKPDTLTWWQIGRFVADGYVNNQVNVYIGKGKESDADNFHGWTHHQQETALCLTMPKSAAERDWLTAHFGKLAHGKTIPAFLLAETEENRRAFLEGYWSGDGWKPKGRKFTQSNSVSACLTTGVELLAKSLGYTCTVSQCQVTPTKVIEGRTVNQRPWWMVRATPDDGRFTETDTDWHWFKLRRDPKAGEVTSVYDLTVEDDHSFVAAGIVVHNCQDMSTAGKRAGMIDGTRSGLWSYQADAVAALRPKAVVWENVRGALTARALTPDGRPTTAILRVTSDLTGLGYVVRHTIVRASDVGAPHQRARVFLLATLGSNGGGQDPMKRLAGGHDVSLEDQVSVILPTPRVSSASQTETVRLLPTPVVNDMGEGKAVEVWDEWVEDMRARHGNGNGHGKSLNIEVQRLLPTPRASDTNGAGVHGHGGMDLRTAARDFGPYKPAVRRWEQTIGRPAPAPTEPGRNGHPRLSAEFAEWMMGLPAGWVTAVPGVTRGEALKLVGNGVVPQQAAHALRVLAREQTDDCGTPNMLDLLDGGDAA